MQNVLSDEFDQYEDDEVEAFLTLVPGSLPGDRPRGARNQPVRYAPLPAAFGPHRQL